MAERFRTTWKGHLRLSLVTIPVRMVAATQTAGEVRFNQLHRETGQRVRYQKTVPGVGPVDKEDIVRGYEFEPGQYVVLSDEELDSVKLETRHTIELTQFVEACEIDPLYFEKPYYLLPDGDVAEEGYRVIRDALREMGKVGIGQQSIRGRENLVTIHPAGNGLLLETLRYEEEVKEADEVFVDIAGGKLRGDLIDMAKDLVQRRSMPFDPDRFENHYTTALRDLVRRKIESGGHISVGEGEERPGTVVDFMEALRRSLAREGGGTEDSAGTGGKADARTSGKAEPAKAAKPARSRSRKPEAAKASDEPRAGAPGKPRAGATGGKAAASSGRRKAG